jgi:hypothetical protein
MAQRKPTTRSRSSGASKPKRTASRSANRSAASKRDRDPSSAQKQVAKAATGGKPMGRPPSEEPDVFVDVPNVHVGRLEIDVERLQAHLALRAQVANLVNLVAGVHVDVDKVKIDLEDVDASALLKVRLQNTYNILDRTLTTIDEHPEILQGAVDSVGAAVDQVGGIGKEATKRGGALSELTSGIGDALGNLSDSLGDTVTHATEKLNPRRLVSDRGQGESDAESSSASTSENAFDGKTAAGLAAGGLAGLLGSILYRAQRRPRLLGVPIGRRRGAERVAKQIGKVGSSGRELMRAHKTAERLLP